jgi:hypothetical protein
MPHLFPDGPFPGGSTLPALTGLLALRRDLSLGGPPPNNGDEIVGNNGAEPARSALTGPSSLVGLARAQGFRVEVYGWYNPYCDLLAGSLDACRSVSMYNTASVADHFAIWHPVTTTFNLWPHQWPTGLAKNPVAVSYHRAMLQILSDSARIPDHFSASCTSTSRTDRSSATAAGGPATRSTRATQTTSPNWRA